MITLIFLLAFDSGAFLQLSPGVMSQGLGGSSIVIDEGLSVFHNPAYTQDMRFNFTLARWLYSTNYLALGGAYSDNLFGITYLGYGHIQGYDVLGNPTHQFTPYDVCIAIGRKLGPFGIALKGFAEKIDDHTLYGLSVSMGIYAQYRKLSIGMKVDNLGKEFAENTSIPSAIGIGLKYNIISEMHVIAETKMPDLRLNGGVTYAYKTIRLLFGLRYLHARNMISDTPIDRNSNDLGVTAGLMVDIDNYTIGYSIVYGHFSVAHHFSVSLVP